MATQARREDGAYRSNRPPTRGPKDGLSMQRGENKKGVHFVMALRNDSGAVVEALETEERLKRMQRLCQVQGSVQH